MLKIRFVPHEKKFFLYTDFFTIEKNVFSKKRKKKAIIHIIKKNKYYLPLLIYSLFYKIFK